MSLSEIELNALKTSCDTNERLMLNVHAKEDVYVYRSRFLAVNFHQGFIIIDEPELSLSVPWQKKFLVDIKKSESCEGFISVTHSPFIFDNELESFTHSIEEFTEEM